MSRTTPATAPARRSSPVLRALAVTAAAGVAVTLASFPLAPAASAAPAAASAASAATFGPDGTHYPSDTPDIRARLADSVTVVDVAASATAIRTALDSLTPAQIAAGAVVRVAPGRIDDLSALDGFTNDGPLKVLITARDGFQSVTGGAWSLKGVTGISLMRFDIGSLDVKGATHSSFAWLRIANNWIGLAASAGIPVRDVELLEIVEPESRLKSGDSAQIKAYAPNTVSDVLVAGDYIAPSYYLDAQYGGSHPERPHTDSLQIEGAGITGQVTVRDTVVFSSNNSAVIVGGVRSVAFDHALILGGGVAAQRYPYLPGGAGSAGAINGKGSVSAVQGRGGGDVDSTDSIFTGSLQPTWDSVSRSTTTLGGKVARSGGFSVDPALSALTAAGLDALAPRPTAAYLAGIWDGVSVTGGSAVTQAQAPTRPTATTTSAPTASAPTASAPTASAPTASAPTASAPTTSVPTAPTAPVAQRPATSAPAGAPAARTRSAAPSPATTATPSPTATASSWRTAPAADRSAPTVTITSPRSGDTISGTTTATVVASDDTAVIGVTFLLGGTEVGAGTSTDGRTWSLTTRTGGKHGTFALTARATDAAGNSTVSAPVAITLR
ncbi:Ig-like domain-containing protein [Rathayibacter sp. VKM Ac-2856]|uniref:Ig-like domain-containing protein n=1 Tax=unclassified Rathayibacter TaxID=2609250 RepID=UPI001564622E|nr:MULTISPECIES: Ig-like domain-containing protein [unclassified Rathayibacter]NQX03440.1 Ig-like domain-containing protein [Rathayibacter sp. VKM Ac-2858]NQX18608.1 Ig-like domain-containing protein [Rathayibacter sp. VKM Ac-2856]